MESGCDTIEPIGLLRPRAFKTSRATLIKYPLSVLGIMFSERQRKLERNSEGVVFLDASPKPFGFVLAWLQRGVVPRHLGDLEAEVLAEAKVWQLDELVGKAAALPPSLAAQLKRFAGGS